jgi:TonB-dependent starch-binding outer membrane protein SusC
MLTLLLLAYLSLFAQNNFSVKGKISDEQGKPMQGVTVNVKGSPTSTATNADGLFSLLVPSGNSVLVVSSIGFAEQTIPVGNRNEINFTMINISTTMQDVVVVGYGATKKSDVTGALSSISAKTIQERPTTNLLQAIQGRAAGMNVATNNKPGELPAVRIRGTRSINASNDPLYVVDGIPIVSALGVTSFSLNDISPNDIQSVEVLKDASATAIYGSRGSNGVILITTKKGSKGRVAINYSSVVSIDSYKSLTDWMDGGQWIDRWREALINGRNYQATANTNLNNAPTIGYPDPFIDRTKMGLTSSDAVAALWKGYEWDVYGVTPKMRATTAAEQALGWPAMVPVYNANNIPTYDWLGAATRQGLTQNHQIAVSSGTDISRLYISLGYFRQTGVQRDQDFSRFNINMNGDITANKWLTLGMSVMANLSKQNFGITTNSGNTGSKDLYSRAADQFPFASPTDTTGAFIRNPGGNLNLWNPIIDIYEAKNERRASSAMANVFSEIQFTPWLKYRINFGAQIRHFRAGAWTGPNATSHLGAKPNTAGYSTDENFSYVVENLLYFDKTFARNHKVGVTLLQSSQKSRRETVNANVSSTIIPIAFWYDLAANTLGKPDGYGSGFTENTLASYMGRVNYTLLDKYLLTASGRFDGSSVLAPGHKWEFFPSFAVAWKAHDEKFLQGVSWLNELKPRIGFGATGNSSVAPYTTTGPLSRNPYIFGSVAAIGYLPQLVQNPELGWEKTAQWNFGIDFAFLKRRISGSIEYYSATTSDLLFSRTLPAVSGYVQKFENIGKTQNKGIEVTLSTVNIDKGNFTWTTDLNWAHNDEQITDLLGGKNDILASRLFIGQPIQVFYHYENAGIWGNSPKDMQEMALFNAAPGNHKFYPGTIKIVDQNGDHRIDASDYVIRGTGRPKWTGGITNTFRYKNWSLNSMIYARVGQTYFGGYPNSYGGANPNGRVENDVWSWTTGSGKWPIPLNGSTVDNFTPAMQYNNGSFFIVRNISLTWEVPSAWLRKVNMKNCQFNLQVLNPFIFGGEVVKWGINPDDETNWASESQPNSNATSPLGGQNNNTILPQSVVFGLRIGF